MTFLNRSYTPERVIVVYTGNGDYYLEAHSISAKGEVSPGVPLTRKAMNKLVKAVKDTSSRNKVFKFDSVVPDNLVYFNCDTSNPRVVWFSPAGKKSLYWTKGMGIPDGIAQVPPMVFVAEGENLTVYALEENKKPIATTKLFRVPFCNVAGNDGSVCTGRTNVETEYSIDGIIKSFESIFWDTRFSGHAMNDEDDSIVKGRNFYDLWKSQAANPENPFPIEILHPTKKTVQSLFK